MGHGMTRKNADNVFAKPARAKACVFLRVRPRVSASNKKPLIGITLGDPNGIGPEVVAKALLRPAIRRLARFCIIAEGWGPHPSFIPQHAQPLQNRDLMAFCRGILGLMGAAPLGRGPTAASGRAAVESVLKAIDLALDGKIDAIVTAPISKEAMRLAGYKWPGHTEILAERTGKKHPVMTMVGGGLIVPLVTTHVSMADLPRKITRQKVLATLRVANEALKKYWGIARPRIAVCGLNPHAGEAGLFGQEEIREIAPACRQARSAGVRCIGPLPADVVFYQARPVPTRSRVGLVRPVPTGWYGARKGRYDAVVAMYHDQANIPVKMLAFESGVNVTLGLPIIRTSPDHGTAYDIAWKGMANAGSMVAAIKLAVQMATLNNRESSRFEARHKFK